jgi:hypothetical protein
MQRPVPPKAFPVHHPLLIPQKRLFTPLMRIAFSRLAPLLKAVAGSGAHKFRMRDALELSYIQ